MNAHLESGHVEMGELMEGLGKAAVLASSVLALAGTQKKNMALSGAAAAIRARGAEILAANERDMAAAQAAKLSGALRAFQAFDMFAEMLGCLEDHSELVTAIGRVSDAVRLGGAIESLRGRRALARAPRDDRRWKAFLAEVRDALSPAEFERAWTDGKTWEMQDAVRFAHAAFAAEAIAA